MYAQTTTTFTCREDRTFVMNACAKAPASTTRTANMHSPRCLCNVSHQKHSRPFLQTRRRKKSSALKTVRDDDTCERSIISAEEMRVHLYDSKDLWSTTLHQTLLCNCVEGEDDESDCAFHFQYMPMRNRIEIPRMLCEAANCKYALELGSI